MLFLASGDDIWVNGLRKHGEYVRDSGKSQPFSWNAEPVEGFVGITGKICDWDAASMLVRRSHIPVILAGGISPENVFEAIRQVSPAGVDSCTGTNATGADGQPVRFHKDRGKIEKMVQEVYRAVEKKISY